MHELILDENILHWMKSLKANSGYKDESSEFDMSSSFGNESDTVMKKNDCQS